MKKISEFISVPNFEKQYTKQQIEQHTRFDKRPQRPKSNNVPKLVRAIGLKPNGEIVYKQGGDGRARFKFKVWWKDEFIINSSTNYGASADLYYKQDKGEQFYYIDERTAYAKLIHLALYTWRDKFKTFMIFLHEDAIPLWSNHKYNICIYKNCYNNEYEYHKGNKLPNFKFTDVDKISTSRNNKQMAVKESFLNMMEFNAK